MGARTTRSLERIVTFRGVKRSGFMGPAPRAALVVVCVLIAFDGASAAASAHKRKPRPLVLHPRFHVVGTASTVDTDGPFVLLRNPVGTSFDASGTLIDEQTGTRTSVSYPGCHLDEFNTWNLLGGPWLMLSCDRAGQWDGGFELYNLYTGEWRAVVPDPTISSFDCGMPPYCGVTIAGFGAHWIEWQTIPCRYCTPTYQFQNIDTGQVQSLPDWRPGGRTIPDLDSPSLARPLCPPLTVPAGVAPLSGGPPPGVLTFYGSFAIVGNVLERCGSRLKLAIGNHNYPAVHANSRAVVWAQGPKSGRLDGLFLPSLRHFVIANTPSTSPYDYGFALSSGELYVLRGSVHGASETVFAAPAPTQSHEAASARGHH
jgi:hypothetical protein